MKAFSSTKDPASKKLNLDGGLRVQGKEAERMNSKNNVIDALVDFLHTQTDVRFVTNEKFADPFLE